MIRISHALTITSAALIGFGFLWLERIYSNTPLLESFTVTHPDSTIALLALIVSGLTSPAVAIIVSISGAVFAIYWHHTKLWWLFVGLLSIGVAASTLLKIIIGFPRPEYGLVQLSTYGFPSTHATVVTIIFLVGSWLVYHWKTLPEYTYRLIIGGMGLSWFIVCISRILLGVHSLSDVLAGVMLGAAISAIALSLAPQLLSRCNIPLCESETSHHETA